MKSFESPIQYEDDYPFELEIQSRSTAARIFHGTQEDIAFEGKKWKQVDSRIDFVQNPVTLWVSLGSSKSLREKLFCDANSKTLLLLKNELLEKAKDKPISQVLQLINYLVRKLNSTDLSEKEFSERFKEFMLSKIIDETKQPEIKMEEFIEEKLLYCRHTALIAALLAAYCVDQGFLPPGKVRVYRSNIVENSKLRSVHGWAVYRENATGILRLFDPQKLVVLNVSKFFKAIAQLDLGKQNQILRESSYGDSTLRDMKKRLDYLDGVCPFIENFNKIHTLFPVTGPASFNAGTVTIPDHQIRLELNNTRWEPYALLYALKEQHITAQKRNHGNDFISIPVGNNNLLFSANIDKLKTDYQRKCREFQWVQRCLGNTVESPNPSLVK